METIIHPCANMEEYTEGCLRVIIGNSTRLEVLVGDLSMGTEEFQLAFSTKKTFNCPSWLCTAGCTSVGGPTTMSGSAWKIRIYCNIVELSVFVWVPGEARKKVMKLSIALSLEVAQVVQKWSPICMVKSKLTEALVEKYDHSNPVCQGRFQERGEYFFPKLIFLHNP